MATRILCSRAAAVGNRRWLSNYRQASVTKCKIAILWPIAIISHISIRMVVSAIGPVKDGVTADKVIEHMRDIAGPQVSTRAVYCDIYFPLHYLGMMIIKFFWSSSMLSPDKAQPPVPNARPVCLFRFTDHPGKSYAIPIGSSFIETDDVCWTDEIIDDGQ